MNNYDPLPWLVLFLPLVAALVITFFLQRRPALCALFSIGAVMISCVLSAVLLGEFVGGSTPGVSLTWLQVGGLRIDFGLHFDALSLLMLLIVTGVGTLIQIYSIVYMGGDPGFARYFAFMSLFTFSMLGVVLSDNFFQMFVFWELVGVSSYLLIGFWYKRPAAADAAKKAFLTNRLGDFGFFTGIVLIWAVAGTLNFDRLHDRLHLDAEFFDTSAMIIGLLIFCGAVGKSAQFPLHTWLPDAMEGPTPVSALIHAATMVAAGVYMLCRVSFLYTASPFDLQVISWIGGLTALLSALIAVQQDDIKRILAYSTLSQLGYMVMAVGLADPSAAMFHLSTHAFFKALLFLSAGAVIHCTHHEQNIWKMGGHLRKKILLTYLCFMVGALALCGLPPLSGFYSKDSILAAAWEHCQMVPGRTDVEVTMAKMLFTIGVVVAFLTTFYIFRLFFVVFFGPGQPGSRQHPGRNRVIAYPMVVLALGAIGGGFMGIKQFVSLQFIPNADKLPFFAPLEPFQTAPWPAMLGLAAFALGLAAAYVCYFSAASDPMPRMLPGISNVLKNKFYFDEFYTEVVYFFHDLPAMVANFCDKYIIQLSVRLIHGTTEWTGRVLRLVQTGNLQAYTLLMAAGAALALYLLLNH